MSNKKTLSLRQPGKLFKPKTRKNYRQSSKYLARNLNKNITFENFKNTNIFSEDSYRYGDKPALVSTQEINTDFSLFVNHTFFHSAVAKVNESFDLILNQFPYDGSNKEIESFEDQLTGYEKYVYDIYPKNVGYLIFSGTQKGESQTNGTFIETSEHAGTEYAQISNNKSGKSQINPGTKPLNIQFFLNIPKQANDNQTIVQKRENVAYNWGTYLSASNDNSKCNIDFLINSGSRSLHTSIEVPKGKFIHVTCEYDNCDQKSKITVLPDKDKKVNHLFSSSSNSVFFDILSPQGVFSIGKGSNVRNSLSLFEPQQTFSGSIDDLRIFHRSFKTKDIRRNAYRSVSGADHLNLYYKFNEPNGSYVGNNIVLDASGNSLNGTVRNYLVNYTRNTGSHDPSPVVMEKPKHSPVLFPSFEKVKSLNTELLADAEDYDDVNPNLITKLIPPHYLEIGNEEDNFLDVLGNLKNSVSERSEIQSNQNTQTSVQLLVKFLLTWAKVFDEIKIYIDHFSKINFVEYDEYDTVSDKLLDRLGIHLGIVLPRLFSNGSTDQIFQGYSIDENPTLAIRNLYDLQNLIWRRILSDVANIKSTKGNLDAIRSVFRSSGIEAENIFNFREYGGSKVRSLESSRNTKKDIINFLNFSGSIGNFSGASLDNQGRSSSSPSLKSAFLSGSRIEPGFPEIRGNFVGGISNNVSDGLFTSSSFCVQSYYTFDKKLNHPLTQSILRIAVTGSDVSAKKEGVVINLIAKEKGLSAHVSDGIASTAVSTIELSDVNIMDGDLWSVSLSKKADPQNIFNDTYFLGAAKYADGKRQDYHYTSSFVTKKSDSVFSNKSPEYNASGSFIIIGSQSIESTGKFINKNSTKEQKSTIFSGQMSYLNFWSSHKTEDEFIGFAKNPNSVGSLNPAINYNFSSLETGSFSRMRIQTYGKQATTSSDGSGNIKMFDFSQNNLHFQGSGFEPNKIVMTPNHIIFESLSENFDLNSSKEKVRVRSVQDDSYLKNNEFSMIAPLYETPLLEEVMDDTRFSIDMSAMKGLNENIMTIFPNFQPLENALGHPNSLFSDDYFDIRSFRRVYFHNVLEDLDLGRYRSIFKWIDNSYTDLVYSLVPRVTNFMGINFIYESHVLERNKFKYLFDEIYLESHDRANDDVIITIDREGIPNFSDDDTGDTGGDGGGTPVTGKDRRTKFDSKICKF